MNALLPTSTEQASLLDYDALVKNWVAGYSPGLSDQEIKCC